MYIRWIGAALILAAGGGFGLFLVHDHRKEEWALEELIRVLDLIISEIQFRMTPLPQLCAMAANQGKGAIKHVFSALEAETLLQTQPDGAACMNHALERVGMIPRHTYRNLKMLGQTLGRFDAEGQLRGMEAVKTMCIRDLKALQDNRDIRMRNYQTLGICAGIALVIVLI